MPDAEAIRADIARLHAELRRVEPKCRGSPLGKPHRSPGSGSVSEQPQKSGALLLRVRLTQAGVTHRGEPVWLAPGYTRGQLHRARDLAEEHRLALKARVGADDPPDPARERRTIHDWYDVWATEKRAEVGADSSTWDGYRRSLEKHVLPRLGHLRVTALRVDHVLAWRSAMRDAGMSPTYLNQTEGRLRMLLTAPGAPPAHKDVLGMALPKKERATTPPAFSLADLAALLAVAPEPWRTAWLVAFHAVLRFGELAGLRWRHVLWDLRRLDVAEQRRRRGGVAEPKHGSAGPVALSEVAMAALRAHLEREQRHRPCRPDDPVFLTPVQHRPLQHGRARTVLIAQMRLAGLERLLAQEEGARGALFHALRHGGAHAMGAANVSALAIRDQLRQRDLRTTAVYLQHRDEPGQRAAAAALGPAATPPRRGKGRGKAAGTPAGPGPGGSERTLPTG